MMCSAQSAPANRGQSCCCRSRTAPRTSRRHQFSAILASCRTPESRSAYSGSHARLSTASAFLQLVFLSNVPSYRKLPAFPEFRRSRGGQWYTDSDRLMASPIEPDPQAARPAIPPSGVRLRPGVPAATTPAEGPRWKLALVALALLCLFHPLTWGPPTIPLWSPQAGLAL